MAIKKSRVVKPPDRPKVCPYCGARVTLERDSKVYGGKSYGGKVYRCCKFPECNSYVGVHRGTKVAFGLIADPELRRVKTEAHNVFDILWKYGPMTRRQAYRWLSSTLEVPQDLCHIGYFNKELCEEAIQACVTYIRTGGRP